MIKPTQKKKEEKQLCKYVCCQLVLLPAEIVLFVHIAKVQRHLIVATTQADAVHTYHLNKEQSCYITIKCRFFVSSPRLATLHHFHLFTWMLFLETSVSLARLSLHQRRLHTVIDP